MINPDVPKPSYDPQKWCPPSTKMRLLGKEDRLAGFTCDPLRHLIKPGTLDETHYINGYAREDLDNLEVIQGRSL